MPADVWFEWSSKITEKSLVYKKLSVEDVFKQKNVPWPVVESADIDSTEFRPLEVDIIMESDLIIGHGCSEKKKCECVEKSSYTSS